MAVKHWQCSITCAGGCLVGCAAPCAADGPLPFGDVIGATAVNATTTTISYSVTDAAIMG